MALYCCNGLVLFILPSCYETFFTITTVWTICILCWRIFLIVPITSITPSCNACSRMMFNPINVPVLPTPALQYDKSISTIEFHVGLLFQKLQSMMTLNVQHSDRTVWIIHSRYPNLFISTMSNCFQYKLKGANVKCF